MSEEFNQNNPEVSENQDAKKIVKKVIKKKTVSQFAGGSGGQSYGSYGGYGGYGAYGSNYGGSYGGYGYGYGYGYGQNYGQGYSYGAPQPQLQGPAPVANRTLADYLHILRERFWFIIITFIIIVAGTCLYTFKQEKMYTSVATLQMLRRADNPVEGGTKNTATTVMNLEDLNTQVQLLNSASVIDYVKRSLKEEEKKRLLDPYRTSFNLGGILSEESILSRNRRIVPNRMSLVVNISFSHPDREIAMIVANAYADQFIAFTVNTNSADLMNTIHGLNLKAKQQDEKVKELDKKLLEYRISADGPSPDSKIDLVGRELEALTQAQNAAKMILDGVFTNYSMSQEYERAGKDLTTLPFIAIDPKVASLLQQKTSLVIELEQLSKRYKEKHPTMVQLNRRMQVLQQELDAAIALVVLSAKTTYEMTEKTYAQYEQNLAAKKEERRILDKKSVEYDAILRERQAAIVTHLALEDQKNRRIAEVNLIPPSARIVDRAFMAAEHSYPNIPINILVGILAGIAGGILMALFVAFIDDRAKSAHDIEAIVGIPLLGGVPRIKKLSSAEKAQVAASNADSAATEVFRGIYSALKLSPVGKNAKVILSTSTTPSEGKSFVLFNLAFTAAIHGEKCLVIDADMRLPSMAKVFGIETDKGVVAYAEGREPLENCIIKEYFPNLDVLPCEKRVSNPTQIINSDTFINMVNDLRQHYDKIFIDTPPIGAVSDTLSVLPLVDGIIYVVKFNAIKRKVIKGHIKRLLETNVPILGAVMNMVTASSQAQSYTSNYYNKNYRNYYLAGEEVDDSSYSEAPQAHSDEDDTQRS